MALRGSITLFLLAAVGAPAGCDCGLLFDLNTDSKKEAGGAGGAGATPGSAAAAATAAAVLALAAIGATVAALGEEYAAGDDSGEGAATKVPGAAETVWSGTCSSADAAGAIAVITLNMCSRYLCAP